MHRPRALTQTHRTQLTHSHGEAFLAKKTRGCLTIRAAVCGKSLHEAAGTLYKHPAESSTLYLAASITLDQDARSCLKLPVSARTRGRRTSHARAPLARIGGFRFALMDRDSGSTCSTETPLLPSLRRATNVPMTRVMTECDCGMTAHVPTTPESVTRHTQRV